MLEVEAAPLPPRRLCPPCHPAVDALPLASARRAGAAPRGGSAGPRRDPPTPAAIPGSHLRAPRPRGWGRPRPRPRASAALPWSVPPCAAGGPCFPCPSAARRAAIFFLPCLGRAVSQLSCSSARIPSMYIVPFLHLFPHPGIKF